jgi:hypothetical protein
MRVLRGGLLGARDSGKVVRLLGTTGVHGENTRAALVVRYELWRR